MRKTTVYLPADLKAELERTAHETGRTEAEVIRQGIRLVVAERKRPRPSIGAFDFGDPTLSERLDDLLEGFGEQ